MAQNICPQCGAPLPPGATRCKYCGEVISQPQQYAPPPPPAYAQQPPYYTQQPCYMDGIDPRWPIKNKIVAGLFGIFLGGLGIHKFYLGKTGMGILYILFCWTGIPEVVGFIEGIVYLASNDHNFQVKHHVRLQ